MTVAFIGRQVSAGIIVGLSAIVYSLSYGTLLFSGSLSVFVGIGITIALITAVVGCLFGFVSEHESIIAGPDSNTISVLASMLTIVGSVGTPALTTLQAAAVTILLTSVVSAIVFYAVARADLSTLIRYIPFPVTAGFLASTGWLMTSGALSIISQTPLSRAGWDKFVANPFDPQLGAGIAVAVALFALAPRVAGAKLIPLVVVVTTLVVNITLQSGLCTPTTCDTDAWLFPRMTGSQWLPPWDIDWHLANLRLLVEMIPSALVVAFVGLLTTLLSMASLELSLQKEFNLNATLKVHAFFALLSAFCGGFVSIVSISRTTISQKAGGGVVAGAIAASVCVAMLFGAGDIVAYVPKIALGGLVLYLGTAMLKEWIWDQRRKLSASEFAQILIILLLVAKYGFLVGFSAGLLISCFVFIVSYSMIPLVDLSTDLSLFASSVVRPEYETEILRQRGNGTLLYRLSGYVFFGSASKIETIFQKLDDRAESSEGVVIDFTRVTGIDSSAVSVFRRILRRYSAKPVRFYLVYSNNNESTVRQIGSGGQFIDYFLSLDRAIEAAEEKMISRACIGHAGVELLDVLSSAERQIFFEHCELRRIPRGELLCREGEHSDELFFVKDGSLEVFRAAADRSELRLAKLTKGTIVGEQAFYTGEVRSATILAAIDSLVYVLRRNDLDRLRAKHPGIVTKFDLAVIRKISRALTRTNKLASTLR